VDTEHFSKADMARAAYDAVAEKYDRTYSGPVARAEDRFVQSLLKPMLRTPVIDIGCGTGIFFDWWPHLVGEGIDISPGMLAMARCKHPLRALHLADARTYTPRTGFNLAVSLYGSLSYLPLPAAVRCLQRVLAPGGLFFVMLYSQRGYSRVLVENRLDVPMYAYSRDQIRRLFNHHFDLVRIRSAFLTPMRSAVAFAAESKLLTWFAPSLAWCHIVTGRVHA